MASTPADALFGDAASSVHPAGHDGGGSYVPVIVVLVLIAVVTAASVAVGQLFVGSQGRRRTGYDMEAYVMRRFSTCLGVAEPIQLVRPVDNKKKMKASFVQLDDGAEEVVEPSAGAPKADDDETASSQKTLP
jgi:hypothetical protein